MSEPDLPPESGYLAGYLAALEVEHEGGPQAVSTVGGRLAPR